MLVSNKGAQAPFFIPAIPDLALTSRRCENLMAQALSAFKTGELAKALLCCEIVCRLLPTNEYAAVFRAHLMAQHFPTMAHKAHFQAWKARAQSLLTQDNLLRSWLDAGIKRPVIELGWYFLAQRMRIGKSDDLTAILKQADAEFVSACWANESQLIVEYEFFAAERLHDYQLLLINETEVLKYTLTSIKQRLIFSDLNQSQVWSVCWHRKTDGLEILSSGSPVRLAPILKAATKTEDVVCKHEVLIIVPVYRGLQQVQDCLYSVLQSFAENSCQASLLIIDDASPETDLRAWLTEIARHPGVQLIQNRVNLGFIESVNRGFIAAAGKHVLLLNSDTLVTGNWLDLMLESLLRAPDVASVSAWSNNGEVSSFPVIATASPAPDRFQLQQLQMQLQQAVQHRQIEDQEIPVCCGFAMLIHAQALQQVGLLDGYSLQRGYGEEVEWCLRASAQGYRHLLNPRVFVAHYGSSSFRAEKIYRVSQNLNVIYQRYPEYRRRYREFVINDGLAKVRKDLLAGLQTGGNFWLTILPSTVSSAQPINWPDNDKPDEPGYIVIWQNEIVHGQQEKVMQLAYKLSAAPDLNLSLLIIGEAFESVWGTGACYVLPKNHDLENQVVQDWQFLNWLNIKFLLTFDAALFKADQRVRVLDDNFNAGEFIAELKRQKMS